MVTELAGFFRYTMLERPLQTALLGDEIAALRDYLAIERIRFGERLAVNIVVDDAAAQCTVPAFLVHPLVENALKHGSGPTGAPLALTIRAETRGDRLAIEVWNTGTLRGDGMEPASGREDASGLAPSAPRGDRPRVGLKNIRARLERMFPDAHGFTLEPRDGGVLARVELPCVRSGVPALTAPPRPVLIVDDERLARRDLRDLLETQHASAVRIAGEAATVQDAATLARTSGADLVFLDIHLAGESGFDLLPLLEPDVEVVFVTAFDQHAVRAFEVNALDYLTKPVSPDRLAMTIARLRAGGRSTAASGASSDSAGPLAYDDRLFLRIDDRMAFLAVRDVVAIVADGDNAALWLANGRVVRVRKSLRSWEERLPAKQFVRIHRSALVNLTAVERVEEWSHFTYRIYVRGYREPLEMSRRYGARVREQLG